MKVYQEVPSMWVFPKQLKPLDFLIKKKKVLNWTIVAKLRREKPWYNNCLAEDSFMTEADLRRCYLLFSVNLFDANAF